MNVDAMYLCNTLKDLDKHNGCRMLQSTNLLLSAFSMSSTFWHKGEGPKAVESLDVNIGCTKEIN